MTLQRSAPEPGWGVSAVNGLPTFVQVGGDCLASSPPKLDGYEPFWVARHGVHFVRWIYKPVQSKEGKS